MQDIRIGTLVPNQNTGDYLRQTLPHGFESFSVMFWQTLAGSDLSRLAEDCHAALADSDAVISSLNIYGDALIDNAEAQETRRGWERLIDAAPSFGCDLVTGSQVVLSMNPSISTVTSYRARCVCRAG